MKNLGILGKRTVLFSNPEQMIQRGSKLQVIEDLKIAAKTITNTYFPEVALVQFPFSSTLPRDGLVLKRNFSELGKHVLLPGDQEFHQKTKVFEREQRRYNNPVTHKYGVAIHWFCVPFVKDVRTRGEIRVYFIGGRLAYMVATKPRDGGGLDVQQVFMTTPLDLLL